MGFASGSVSFRRFYMPRSIPTELDDALIKALNKHSFGRRGGAASVSEPVEFGWVTPRHLFDYQFDAEKIAFGRYVHVALRVDRLAPPGQVLKSYERMEEDVAREASGRDFLSKADRRQARERARLRAEKEMQSGGFRRSAGYGVLMDLKQRVLLFAQLGPTAGGLLTQLFHRTFEAELEPAEPQRLAFRVLKAGGDVRALEHLKPFALARPTDADDDDAESDGGEDLNFLGREFLTWLWWCIDSGDARLELPQGGRVAATIDRVMRLDCGFGRTGHVVVTRDGPAVAPESRAARRSGKQPTRMGLIVGGDAGEFSLVLDGPRMAVTGLALPKAEAEGGPRDLLERRFEQIFDAGGLLDGLFAQFIQRRASGDWTKQLRAMTQWAKRAESGAVMDVERAVEVA